VKNKWYMLNFFPLLVLLSLLLAACNTPFPLPTSSAPPNEKVDWYSVRIFPDHSGWALTSRGVLHTEDSGSHWTVVTPPALTTQDSSTISAAYFLNSQNAWIAKTGATQYIRQGNNQPELPKGAGYPSPVAGNIKKQQPELAHVFHTADGGKTWQSSEIPDTASTYTDTMSGAGFVAGAFAPQVPYGENRGMVAINSIISTDAQNVWVSVSNTNVHTGGGEEIYTNVYRRLWHSTNGGQSWNKAWEDTNPTFPNSGAAQVYFANKTTGLMSGSQQLDVMVTHDGQTWQGETLPSQGLTSQDLSVTSQVSPVLFNAQDGVVSLQKYESGGRYGLYLYTTHDGGQTWQKAGQLEVPQYPATTEAYDQTVNYLDTQHWLVAADSVLYSTNDGGQHWQTLSLPQEYRYTGSLSFVSGQEGWAIGKSLSTSTATPSQQTQTSSLIHTSNGGQTWEKVNYQIS
jgi:photosystem II stability/assembly factor-like uncharacterized protein